MSAYSEAPTVSSEHSAISVAMPAYNAEHYLPEAINSVLKQSVENWELIIVDDGSSDKTAEIAQNYAQHDPRIQVIRQSNGGPGAARNQAIQRSSSKASYIAFLDADDIWDADALETLMALLEAHPDLVAAHGHERAMDACGTITSRYHDVSPIRRRAVQGSRIGELTSDEPTTFGALALQNCVPSNGILVRRQAFDKAGLFDPDRHIIEDWDLWRRLSLLTDIARTSRIVYSYREHSGGLSKDTNLNVIRELSTRRKLWAISRSNPATRQIARTALRCQERELLSYRLRRIAFLLRHGRFHDLSFQIRLLRYALIV